MKYSQRDIVFVNYPQPDGSFKPHPGLIVSVNLVFELEEIYIMVMLSTKTINEEFAFEITQDMLNSKSNKEVFYAKCQIIASFQEYEIIRRFGSIKKEYFAKLIQDLSKTVFGIDLANKA